MFRKKTSEGPNFRLSAEAERMMVDSGFFQLSVRDMGKAHGCMEGMSVKVMPVTPEQVFESFGKSRADMEKLFVR